MLFLCSSSRSVATFLHRSTQTLSICLFPLENFQLSSNGLLSLLCSRNQVFTENHYLTTGQSLIFSLSQNSLSLSPRTALMNTCRPTPCSIFSNLATQSFISLNLIYWWSMIISLNQKWTDSKPLVFSTRSLGCIRYNRPLHTTPSPHFMVWYATVLSLGSSHIYFTCPFLSAECRPTSDNVGTSSSESAMVENVGVAFEISLLSHSVPEI